MVLSSVLMSPSRRASAATCQYWTCPPHTSAARRNDCPADTDLVKTSRRRFGRRSTTAPEKTENSSIGVNWSVLISPSWKGSEPVELEARARTGPPVCIQRPTCERTNPDR